MDMIILAYSKSTATALGQGCQSNRGQKTIDAGTLMKGQLHRIAIPYKSLEKNIVAL
jgi:hypothetical protein